jgi:hypothetical protein
MTPKPATRAPRPSTSPRSSPTHQLEQLAAEAQHHRNRLALYKRRVLTGQPSSAMRLEELRRLSAAADARLAHARLELEET